MHRKAYRDAYVSAHVSNTVAAQIEALREARGWKQADLAERIGTKQSRISVLENPNNENFEVKTLLKVASAFDVGLSIRFVPYSSIVEWADDISQDKLVVREFARDALPMQPAELPWLINFDQEPVQETAANEVLPTFGPLHTMSYEAPITDFGVYNDSVSTSRTVKVTSLGQTPGIYQNALSGYLKVMEGNFAGVIAEPQLHQGTASFASHIGQGNASLVRQGTYPLRIPLLQIKRGQQEDSP